MNITCILALLAAPDGEFHVAHDPKRGIVDSAVDSLRFTVEHTLKKNEKGRLASISTFVDQDGKVMDWHDFGTLEGPGWASNAVGGAHEIHAFGRFLGKKDWEEKALSILDHVLDDGFIDESTGFIKGYWDLKKKAFCLNYKHNSDWFCPGSMAKVAYQLLVFSDDLKGDPRAARMRGIATKCGEWLYSNVKPCDNGWFPRRVTPSGEVYKKSPDGGEDKLWSGSADGLFILQLWTGLKKRGLADYTQQIAEKTAVFARAGGIFGSINQDTYDEHENVAYSVAFRVVLEVSYLLGSDPIRAFAYSKCLGGLDQFKMTDDRNGVATKGLLFMEKSWPTAYLWENAEAALAYFEAAHDLRNSMPDAARRHEQDGLTILRAIARHHHGKHGFLTEGVDWSNHVGKKHHFEGAEFGDIQYTEPFLNNQHIAEPTLFYLAKLAKVTEKGKDAKEWRDAEGHVIHQAKR